MPIQHVDFEELARYSEKALPSTRRREIKAHLSHCPSCRDQLDQWEANNFFLASVAPLQRATQTNFPEKIDRLVLPQLRKRLSPSAASPGGDSRFKPNRKPSHRDAPEIPNYTLLHKIGDGAFGVVWQAEDLTGKGCAIKVLRKQDKTQSGEYELGGIRKAREVQHPNLVQIRHVGETAQYWYYAMELVATTLEKRLTEEACLAVEDAKQIIAGLLRVLGECHNKGIAHRDIKPPNIGFDSDGTLKLLDLGLVTAAQRSGRTLIGTPDYMPHKPANTPAKDDLYATGIILFRMLTGQMPPEGEIPAKPQRKTLNSGLGLRLYQAAWRATQPAPSARFQSAEEFLQAIDSTFRVRKPTEPRIDPRTVTHRKSVAGEKQTTISNNNRQNIMKTNQEVIKAGAELMGKLGFTERQNTLLDELDRMAHQNFKVAVIGQFKVGKSTLINKVFLKQDVLFTDLMEATAVPTEIEYGQPSRLEVYPYVSAIEGPPWVKENPEPKDIKSHTSAQGDEARAQMARDTSRARLLWPAESLKGLTVVDTPGINTPNEAVAATTYRVIPDADVTVFMTRAQQLTEIDIAFLRSRVFDQGVSRCLAVVTYDPKACNQTELNKVLSAHKAKLGAIGRAYVPVVGVNLSTKVVEGNLGDKIISEEIKSEIPIETDSLAAFEQTLSSFIRQNALPGRMERANSIFRRELEKARLECQVELSSLQKTEEEKSAIKKKIEAESEAYYQRYLRLGDRFLQDLRSIQRFHMKAIADGLDAVAVNYATKINNCSGLGEIQELLRKAQSEIQPDVEELMYRVSDQTRNKVAELEKSYQADMQEVAEPWVRTVVNELQIDGGFLARVPTWTIWLADIIIFTLIMPGGGFIDIILRLIASKIPVISEFLPVSLATKAIAHKAKESVTGKINEIKTQIREQLDRGFIEAEKKIQENWGAHGQEQLKTILDPIERTMQEARDPKRAQLLESGLQSINGVMAQLG